MLLIGVLLFNFVGFELPNSAGEEMTNPQRDVPFGIARSAVASVILYALPVIGILIVLPSSAVTNFSGFISAIRSVFTVYGGNVAADGTAALTGAAWSSATSAPAVHPVPAHLRRDLDHGRGPGAGRVLLRRGGPPGARRDQRQVRHAVRVNVFSGVVATVVVILAQQITSGNAAKYFNAVLGVTISTTLISYLFIFRRCGSCAAATRTRPARSRCPGTGR